MPPPVIPPPPPRRRRRWVLPLVALWVAVGVAGAVVLVRGGAERVRTGGDPEMAELLEATGLDGPFTGLGAQTSGSRLGVGSEASAFQTYRAAGATTVPYDRIAPLLDRSGWQPHPCSFEVAGSRCWVQASRTREGVTYELRVEPARSPDEFAVSVTEL